MGTSNWQQIPFCIELLMKIEPRRVLDVGVGFGRWGMIVREFCDVWFHRVLPEDWAVEVVGIEAFPRSVRDYHAAFYNTVHVGDAADVLPALAGAWDVIIYGDVLEHFTKDKAVELLQLSLGKSKYVIVNIPLGEDHPQGESYENRFEQHLSSWEAAEFCEFALVRKALFHDYCGRSYGSFCLSKEDPRDLRSGLFSSAGLYAGAGTDGRDLVHQLQETAGELSYIKNSSTYRRAIRLRQSPVWNALRWLKSRNERLVQVQARVEAGGGQAGEVWLLEARPNAEEPAIPWDFIERDANWRERFGADYAYGRCLVSSGGRLRVPVDQDPELKFLTRPSGGQVEITFQGRTEVIGLQSPGTGTLIAHPARTPMAAGAVRPAAPAPSPPSSNGAKAAPRAGFTPAERALIESLRQERPRALAVHCPQWLGITSSTRSLFEHTYAVPAPGEGDPFSLGEEQVRHHGEVILAAGARQIVFSGGDACHLELARYLHRRDASLRIHLLWHGSYLHFREDYVWGMLNRWIEAAREGLVHTIGVVKKGLERFLQTAGVRSALVLNYLPGEPSPPPEIPGDDHHVGMWFSGSNEMKSPHVMLAALAMLPRVRLHAAGLNERSREVLRRFGVATDAIHDRPLPHGQLLAAMRRTHLTLYVTFTECCPMLPLESLSVGVPCLIGPTSHLFEDHPYLFSRLVVSSPDRADVIADQARCALNERDRIMKEYAAYLPGYVEAARRSVEEFLS